MRITDEQLTGKTEEHLACSGSFAGVLHRDVVEPFRQLQSEAKIAGFDLQIVSGFRSFERQLRIWNAKACGERPVLDEHSRVLNIERLSEDEKMYAILRWSALPGASRHHWGTDFDVYDASAVNDDYDVQLTPEETIDTGPFAELHRWLDKKLPETGFYRPYVEDRGGIAPERWHLSYAPVSDKFVQYLSSKKVFSGIQGVDIALRSAVEEQIDEIYSRYVWVV